MTYNTEKRKELLKFLSQHHHKSYTVEEICDNILTGGRGKSTVYRQISKLVECGSVRKISDEKTRHVTYQYVGGEHCASHLHLKCKECGTLIHLDCATSTLLEEKIKDIKGFAIEVGSLIYGVCEKCAPVEEGGEI
jgi:Fur family ferric uptake transcriptional regulator